VSPGATIDWDQIMADALDNNVDPLGGSMLDSGLGLTPEDFVPNKLIGLGQFEQLPPYEMMEDL
jgi:hypothetical protein